MGRALAAVEGRAGWSPHVLALTVKRGGGFWRLLSPPQGLPGSCSRPLLSAQALLSLRVALGSLWKLNLVPSPLLRTSHGSHSTQERPGTRGHTSKPGPAGSSPSTFGVNPQLPLGDSLHLAFVALVE